MDSNTLTSLSALEEGSCVCSRVHRIIVTWPSKLCQKIGSIQCQSGGRSSPISVFPFGCPSVTSKMTPNFLYICYCQMRHAWLCLEVAPVQQCWLTGCPKKYYYNFSDIYIDIYIIFCDLQYKQLCTYVIYIFIICIKPKLQLNLSDCITIQFYCNFDICHFEFYRKKETCDLVNDATVYNTKLKIHDLPDQMYICE